MERREAARTFEQNRPDSPSVPASARVDDLRCELASDCCVVRNQHLQLRESLLIGRTPPRTNTHQLHSANKRPANILHSVRLPISLSAANAPLLVDGFSSLPSALWQGLSIVLEGCFFPDPLWRNSVHRKMPRRQCNHRLKAEMTRPQKNQQARVRRSSAYIRVNLVGYLQGASALYTLAPSIYISSKRSQLCLNRRFLTPLRRGCRLNSI